MTAENNANDSSIDAILARDAAKEGSGEGANPEDLAIETTAVSAANYAEALRLARAQR